MQRWTVVVPAKRLGIAKTRLRSPGAAPGQHDGLVLAMLADTLTAALASPAVGSVLVVTDDPAAAEVARSLGASVVPDEPDNGLNAALAHGAAVARARGAVAVAALSSDLAALRSEELTAALTAAASSARAFVPDAAGTGTTLLTAVGVDLDPRFGAGSAAIHELLGAVQLTRDWPGLRRDVDTVEDLHHTHSLGLGSETSRWVTTLADTLRPDGIQPNGQEIR